MSEYTSFIEIPLTEKTVLRLAWVLGVADGEPIALDCRLYRCAATSLTFGPTSAGLRLPMAALPKIAEAFTAMARKRPMTPPRDSAIVRPYPRGGTE